MRSSKVVALIFVMTLSAFFYQNCDRTSPVAPADADDVAVSAAIQFADGPLAGLNLTQMILVVNEKDKSKADSIGKNLSQQELTMHTGGARGQVKVPKNKELYFTVTAYMDTVPVLQGRSLFKATGKSSLRITLDFLIPALILTPSDTTVTKGGNFTVYVQARHVVDMSTIGTLVKFDTSQVQVQDLGREDAFLKGNGGSVNSLKFSKDNDKGTVTMVLGVFPGSAAVSGDGKIGRIVFTAKSKGSADLQLLLDNIVDPDLGLYDKNANLIFAIGLGGRVTITE